MQEYFVYILKCCDGSYYVGHTDNLEKRLAEHQNDVFVCYTSSRLPVSLVFADVFSSRDDAFARERQIKGWSRKKKEALIQGDWEKLKLLAKNYTGHGSTSSP